MVSCVFCSKDFRPDEQGKLVGFFGFICGKCLEKTGLTSIDSPTGVG
ncbi:MAG: hypothetical protein R6U44_08885 [Archaeoglobaceae archaeon]